VTPAPLVPREPDDDAPRGLGNGPGGNGGANGGSNGSADGGSNGNGGQSGGGPPPGRSYRIADPVGIPAPAPGFLDGLTGAILRFLFGA
jgi:hypothetical protein